MACPRSPTWPTPEWSRRPTSAWSVHLVGALRKHSELVSATIGIVGFMPTVADLSLPPEYLRWQERLAREFFEGREGQPVVMFVDLDDLRRLAAPGEDPVRSLAGAVKRLVNINRG